ncbi:hypothetical protein [Prochlorococcus marinus]|uniref:O-antigen polymerase n=1 Tax=Prochlorococcus marinus XMU1408 TaxID=2213228 RepID=A0A318R5W8_PROMR|nr:hypothetical protein [Prochlorococcus marinus]MBW3041834.1 hypothetical protein [Prochlorococcus marinus str. XMU1408]PYE02972.1 hypothetical protein DNJ73_04285 [Prochlorococcus marinus XMU1408]
MKISKYLLYSIIIPSGFKFFGLTLASLLSLPLVLIQLSKWNYKLPIYYNYSLLAFIYFTYLIIQSIIGVIILSDLRILYWCIYFAIVYIIYIANQNYILYDCNYRKKFNDIIFASSLTYFIVYFIVSIIGYLSYGNFYTHQDDFFVGSSGAFLMGVPLLASIYNLWKKANFNLNSRYILYILFYLINVIIHDSRLGLLILVPFLSFYIIESVKPSNIFNIILVLSICIGSWGSIAKLAPVESNNFTGLGNSIGQLFFDERLETTADKLQSDYVRLISLSTAYKKLQIANPYEFLFGTGWYTSRELLKPLTKDVLAASESRGYYFILDDSSLQAEGFVLLITDLGLVGFTFTLIFIFLTFRRIFRAHTSLPTKLLFSFYLLIVFFTLFIGNPLNMAPFFLLLLPNGILDNLLID